MKKIVALLLVFALLTVGAAAETISPGDQLYLYNSTVLYDSYHRSVRTPLSIIPAGSVVIYLGTIDWGYFVVYGNSAGFIEEVRCRKTYSWEGFTMPAGTSSIAPTLPAWGSVTPTPSPSTGKTYVPEFPYAPLPCQGAERFSVRCGPNTDYLWIDRFPQDLEYYVYYQTKGNGLMWALYEYTYQNVKYRMYTTTSRIKDPSYVPVDNEQFVPAFITKTHTPHFGPGYDYALAEYSIPAGTAVKALYQQYGWLLYDVETHDGNLLRAWAPADCWQ